MIIIQENERTGKVTRHVMNAELLDKIARWNGLLTSKQVSKQLREAGFVCTSFSRWYVEKKQNA